MREDNPYKFCHSAAEKLKLGEQRVTNRGKPPALPGRLPEFDSSGND